MKTRILCFMLLLAATWMLQAHALTSDKQQPTRIEADSWEHSGGKDGANGVSIYQGHVKITKGSIVMTGDKAILHLLNGELQTATINGAPATFQQQPDTGKLVHGTADTIVYHAANNTITLEQHAKIVQGGEQMSAALIHYHLDTAKMQADKGANNEGRVHVIIPARSPDKNTGGNKGGSG